MILKEHTSPDRHGHQYVVQGRPSFQSHHLCDSCLIFRSLCPEAISAYARLATITLVIICRVCKAMFLYMLDLLHPSVVNVKMFDTRVTRDASIMKNFPDGASLRKETLLD